MWEGTSGDDTSVCQGTECAASSAAMQTSKTATNSRPSANAIIRALSLIGMFHILSFVMWVAVEKLPPTLFLCFVQSIEKIGEQGWLYFTPFSVWKSPLHEDSCLKFWGCAGAYEDMKRTRKRRVSPLYTLAVKNASMGWLDVGLGSMWRAGARPLAYRGWHDTR
jgi:hypothetical protein